MREIQKKGEGIVERYLSDGYTSTRANLDAIFKAYGEEKALIQKGLKGKLITVKAFKSAFDFFFSDEEVKRRKKEYKLDWLYKDFYYLFDAENPINKGRKENCIVAATCEQYLRLAKISDADIEAYFKAIEAAEKEGKTVEVSQRALIKYAKGEGLKVLSEKTKGKAEKKRRVAVFVDFDENWNALQDVQYKGLPSKIEGLKKDETPAHVALQILENLLNGAEITHLVSRYLPSKMKD